jgi:hypothetical protein
MKAKQHWDIRTLGHGSKKKKKKKRESADKALLVRSEVFTAVTTKNGVFWNVKLRSYPTANRLRLRYKSQPVNAMYGLRFSRPLL